MLQRTLPAGFGGDRMQFDQIKRREFITLLGGAAAAWPRRRSKPVVFFDLEGVEA
jgi:hypothetical protein